MVRKGSITTLMLSLMSAVAFMLGASSKQVALAIGQDPTTPPQQPQQDPENTGRQGGRGNQPPAPRPYAQVITSAAKTDDTECNWRSRMCCINSGLA